MPSAGIDANAAADPPGVAIILTQRDRFSPTPRCLASLQADRSIAYRLLIVDSGSPRTTRDFLADFAARNKHAFLLRAPEFLRANSARKLALPNVGGAKYICLLDNDVIVEQGWLKALVQCAEDENADVVAPLVMESNIVLSKRQIHVAGLEVMLNLTEPTPSMRVSHFLHHAEEPRTPLRRMEVTGVEFHCVLVRASLLELVELDEAFDVLESHVDFCLAAQAKGARIFVEPSARVTFLNPAMDDTFREEDLSFFRFKWDAAYVQRTLQYEARKWAVPTNDPYLRQCQEWATKFRHVPINNRRAQHKAGRAALKAGRTVLRMSQQPWIPSVMRSCLETLVFRATYPSVHRERRP